MRVVDNILLSGEQENAIELCCDVSNRIAAVTGGAGTGKTLILGFVYHELAKKYKVALCAPTGRAAKRVFELTGIRAKTIHKLLEYPRPNDDPIYNEDGDVIPPRLEPKRNSTYPFDEFVILVDESSMVGPELYRQLIGALQKRGVIRFFGDDNQLLPVEEGAPPFRTVLKKFPAITLSYNFRSGDEVVGNAYRILRGQIPLRNRRFDVWYSDSPLMSLLKHVERHPECTDDDHQIIMPTRKGPAGTIRINPSIQVKLNRSKELLRLPRFSDKEFPLVVRANDKFLWVKNDYQLDLFNGEIGRISRIDTEDGSIWLRTVEGRSVEIPPSIRAYNAYLNAVINYDPRKQIELGYAVTTHKAQGSEFNSIVYCMSGAAPFLLNRNNFYTAVTRARLNVLVIADRRAMSLALRRERRD
jgi:exodeoxyribonuclease V alpha subunit